MNIQQLIEALQALMKEVGPGAPVLAQSHGCCSHGHPIVAVHKGAAAFQGVDTNDETGAVVIRV